MINKYKSVIKKLNCGKLFLLISFTVLLLNACNKTELEEIPAQKMHHSYFPLQTGSWYEYAVDSMKFDPFYNNGEGRWDTMRYEMRVEIDTPFTDGEGEQAYKILQYFRPNKNVGWGLPSVAVAKHTANGLEVVKNNNRFVSLTFPVERGKSWDGNIYNTVPRKEDYNFRYTDVHRPMDLNGNHFDSTLTVELVDSKSAIERFYIYERYAAGTGLIYRQETDTNRFKIINNKPVLTGNVNRQSLVSFQVRK